MNGQVSRISDIQLPSSVSTLYVDGSFFPLSSHSTPSMAYAWTAIDSDGFILESHYNTIPSLFPSALRSEVFALLHGLDFLPQNTKITVATDCAQLLSLWSSYVETPFVPRMLKESNHLLWSSMRYIVSQKNLDVTLIKVPAHADDPLNNHVDALAKAAHTDSQISSYNIFDAKSLLTLAVLPRFNFNSPILDINWACTKFCLNNNKQIFSHQNDCSEFCAFHIKILLDMLPTLTTLQRRKPCLYDPSWLFLLDLQTNYLDNLLSASPLIPLPDSFVDKFTAIDYWKCDPPSISCLRLARGLIPMSLTGFLRTYFSPSTIWSILDKPLHNFHFDLYVQIWLCRSVFFHHWESAQNITNKMKSSANGPSSTSHLSFIISPDSLTPSLATVSLDSWVSWVSSSIICGGSWISHLDFWRRLTVQPLLRISFG
ncbi:ribonuclease H-like domain-containing protein [Rhizophagus irregularis DAOM 181602=DAOM 197198]|nr:ribonuclease H-like domain-containing protein [Rhizophagus irregularis DAOM 181602=DAOM 197198]